MTGLQRARGLRRLVTDVVEHGSMAIERIQKETARRPFAILESLPAIAVPARGVHLVYDASVTTTHMMIRLVNRVVGETIDVVLDAAEGSERG